MPAVTFAVSDEGIPNSSFPAGVTLPCTSKLPDCGAGVGVAVGRGVGIGVGESVLPGSGVAVGDGVAPGFTFAIRLHSFVPRDRVHNFLVVPI